MAYKRAKRPREQSLADPSKFCAKLETFITSGEKEGEEVDLNQMLKEFGSERLIGMLHAFVLLKPILSKALREKEEAIVKESDLKRFDGLKTAG